MLFRCNLKQQGAKRTLTSLCKHHLPENCAAYDHALKLCRNQNAFSQTKWVHAHILLSRFDKITFLNNLLIITYGKCGSLTDCRALFVRIHDQNVYSWNSLLDALVQHGRGKETVSLFRQMQVKNVRPDTFAYSSILSAYTMEGSLAGGKFIHAQLLSDNIAADIVIGNTLINMYGKFSCLDCASTVFETMRSRNTVSWNSFIAVQVQNGYPENSLQLLKSMVKAGTNPNNVSFLNALDACASLAILEEGLLLHSSIIESKSEFDVVLGTALLKMYGKCQSVEHARMVFDQMRQKNKVSWNAMMAVYAQNRQDLDALSIFRQMCLQGFQPDQVTVATMLDSCASMLALLEGTLMHALILESGIKIDVAAINGLINMYGKCGCITRAHDVFARMGYRNTISWNIIISMYAQYRNVRESLYLFWQMELDNIEADDLTFSVILSACVVSEDLALGKMIHAKTINKCTTESLSLQNALLNMYGNCGNVELACVVFDRTSKYSLSSWNAVIASFITNGDGKKALRLFEYMRVEQKKSDELSLLNALDVCASLRALPNGIFVHSCSICDGLGGNTIIGTAFINMYNNCGSMASARVVFETMQERDVIVWNAMISSCTYYGYCQMALQLFQELEQSDLQPNSVTFISMLDACTELSAASNGLLMHARTIIHGMTIDTAVANVLMTMYGRCRRLRDAWIVFSRLKSPNVVSWTAMITACNQYGNATNALKLYEGMHLEEVEPNDITYVSILDACSTLTDITSGRFINAEIVNTELESNISVGTALINMYGKCGCLFSARTAFQKMHDHAVASWNAMAAAYAQNGHGEDALEILQEMQLKGMKPDKVTFIIILTACSHVGMQYEGLHNFTAMSVGYCQTPTLEHYGCMVDLCGRVGLLDEGNELLASMPFQPNATEITAFVSACIRC